jgi:hypothetical protein
LSGSCLDRPQDQLALDALELLADLDRACVKVDVGPAQAEGLTAPQAVADEQHERGVKQIGPGREERLGLVSAPWPDGATLPLRQFDEAGHVARDQRSDNPEPSWTNPRNACQSQGTDQRRPDLQGSLIPPTHIETPDSIPGGTYSASDRWHRSRPYVDDRTYRDGRNRDRTFK